MKRFLIFSLAYAALLISLFAQSPVGAWEWFEKDSTGRDVRVVVIFSKAHQVATWFDAESGAFISTNGGTWELDGNTITEVPEFDTRNEGQSVGKPVSFDIEWSGEDQMRINGFDTWLKRIDSGSPGALAGAWLMSGRKRDGQIQERDTTRPRKTMKILSGTRFQWIAYNTETKQFMGTGGGTYSTVDGKYTENIEFFSRDNSRVGASLEFNYELVDGKWHHSGKSSKGAPLYEIWSLRND